MKLKREHSVAHGAPHNHLLRHTRLKLQASTATIANRTEHVPCGGMGEGNPTAREIAARDCGYQAPVGSANHMAPSNVENITSASLSKWPKTANLVPTAVALYNVALPPVIFPNTYGRRCNDAF